jgi:DNA-binding transcriptional ArsR family regulator
MGLGELVLGHRKTSLMAETLAFATCGVNYVFHVMTYGFCMHPASDGIFRALADPTRRAIYERLSGEGEQTVRRLTDYTGVSQPAVSQHLGVLKLAGLVHDRRDGRQTHYSAHPQGLAPLIDWMSHYGAFWRDRFDRLENLLERIDQ